MSSDRNREAHGYARAPGEGKILSMPTGPRMEVKASADETGGRFGLIESHQVGDVPLHVHENDDEAFYILEGEYEIRCGDQTFLAGPGTFVYLPHGVPHAQRLKSDTAKKLILIAPGGFENWFLERSEAMKDGRYDEALSDDLNSRYGIEWLD
jgi:mannose-6-phosphate isomerase-like protein (cupin superfamily)